MPNSIEYPRREAKKLKRAFAAGKVDALARASKLFPGATTLKHADALHVIARENGHESWPRLKLAAEMAAMDRTQRADRLGVTLYYGQHWVTGALLKDDPDLGSANFGLQLALYDRAVVDKVVARDPTSATRLIGVRSPMLHLVFSRHIHAESVLRGDMIAIADLLFANGADINDSFPFEPGSEHRLSALYGALGHADNMPLAA